MISDRVLTCVLLLKKRKGVGDCLWLLSQCPTCIALFVLIGTLQVSVYPDRS